MVMLWKKHTIYTQHVQATDAFGNMLYPYINDIVQSDARKPFEDENFDPVVSGAVIASNGKLTPKYEVSIKKWEAYLK